MLCITAGVYAKDQNLISRAENGEATAQFDLARKYLLGKDGFEKNDSKYVYWLTKAAEHDVANSDVAEAQYYLSQLYRFGEHGVKENISKYLYWAKKSVKNGSRTGASSLGCYYKDFDKEEAIYWFKKCMDMWWSKYGEINDLANDNLLELGVRYNPRSGSSNYASNSKKSSSSSSSSSKSSNSITEYVSIVDPLTGQWVMVPKWQPTYSYYDPNVNYDPQNTGATPEYNSGSSVESQYNSGGSSTNTNGNTQKRKCKFCNGTGRKVVHNSVATFGTDDYKVHCNECGGDFMKSSGHAHVHCNECKGTGYW